MVFKNILKILGNPELRGYYLSGLGHTLLITLIAALIGLFLGFAVAIIKIAAKESNHPVLKILNAIAGIYTTVFRGTPVAVQLFIMVFAVFAIPGAKPYAVILTFGINSGAYVSENIRAGIMSVDKGQNEAGRALGLSFGKTMRYIILPQAVKNIIPAIGNEMIALLKETSIISMVGATVGTLTFDLNSAGKTASIKVADYLAGGLISAAMYLAIVYLMVLVLHMIERRLGKLDKR